MSPHVNAHMTAAGQTISFLMIGSKKSAIKRAIRTKPQVSRLFRAPLRNRTVDLLLTIYPRVHAVANWDDAGQVRGGALCCSPTYLFITPARLNGGPIEAGYQG
jgi:hypothetical protein